MAELILTAPRPRRGAPVWAGLCALAAGLFLATLLNRPALPGDGESARRLADVLLWHSLLPRAAIALLAGAALGLSGALLQRVLRNPIADPSTLGIASGAQLALTLALGFAPGLLAWSREGLAFTGGAVAVGIVLAMSLRRRLDPVTVVIAGMTVSLMAAAASSAIVLARGEYVLSVFIWGAGSLHQQNWSGVVTIAVTLATGAALAALLVRPLTVLSLDDAGARSLGVALVALRVAVIALGVWLAASVIAQVGVIGFLGLAAPAFARISGARTQGQILLRAPLAGALLLSIADGLVHLLGDAIPTGAAVGLIGGPVLLWLLPRVTATTPPAPQTGEPPRRLSQPGRALVLVACGTATLAALSLVVGHDNQSFFLATGALLGDLLPFRAPRIIAAAMAGGLLGAAGALLQRLTGNPLAGPEVLGVSAGGGAGMALALLLLDAPGLGLLMSASAAGALAALLFILAIGMWTAFGPERMLLAGVALGCMCLAVLSAVFATGGWSTFILLSWLAGSTDRVGMTQASLLALGGVLLIAPLPVLGRWLDILPLGGATGRALGLPLGASRLLLCLLAALMTALATFFVGPLSLAGLLAPHVARLLGFVRPLPFLFASVLIGADLLILADWLGRTVAFPYQIPVGFFAALIGGPYLIWLLQRGGVRHG